MVGHISSKEPIVTTVAEQVAQWHGGVREPMDEDRFEKALRVMNGPTDSRNAIKNIPLDT